MRLFIALLLTTTCQVALAQAPVSFRGETMGTTYSVKLAKRPAQPSLDELQQQVEALLETINDQMSTYRPESELSRFNRSNETDWFPVSPETATVVARALEISRQTDGAFDPTVGPLVRLWHFGPEPGERAVPGDDEIAEALERVGYDQISARLDPPALRKTHPHVELDLSAIAKGYGVDAIVELLADQGIDSCMVEIGGEVAARGQKANGRSWKIGIQRPDQLRGLIAATIALQGEALATSGDYRNFFEVDGVRYAHTIDPSTGKPVTHQLASASVVADDCMTADALATALMVLGPAKGNELAAKSDLSVMLLTRDGESFVATTSPAAGEQFSVTPPREQAVDPTLSAWVTFALGASIFALAFLGLGIGVVFSRRAIQGSCGGLQGLKDEAGRPMCEMCTTPREECDEFRRQVVAAGDDEPE